MIRIRKALFQLMLIGCIGGWLLAACISKDGILLGLVDKNAFRGMIVGTISCGILTKPWVFSMEKKGWLASAVFFGILASFLAIVFYFLIWPYESHGRALYPIVESGSLEWSCCSSDGNIGPDSPLFNFSISGLARGNS